MSKRKDIHVVPHGNGWAACREGRARASSVHRTQAEALKRGRDMAKQDQIELVTHICSVNYLVRILTARMAGSVIQTAMATIARQLTWPVRIASVKNQTHSRIVSPGLLCG